MRPIKFRGKRIDNKEWVYGYLYKLSLPSGEACMILTQDNTHLDNSLEPKYDLAFTLWVDLFVVDPATIGQFTGRYDKKGNEIYDGDILQDDDKRRYQVTWDIQLSRWSLVYGSGYYSMTEVEIHFQVVGNIHDNPEILKGVQQ